MIRTRIFQIFTLIFFISCSSNATVEKKDDVLDKDTVIIYDLDDFSSQGAQSVVQYCSGIINNMNLTIYGETGQSRIYYTFSNDTIRVSEIAYRYLQNLESVKSRDDMLLESSNNYTIDAKGSLIKGDTLHNSINIFRDIQQHIPFVLKDK